MASHDPSLYGSYWQAAAGPSMGCNAARPERADIVIVGGGLAGLSTALSILSQAPDRHVVVLESTYTGYGASGRNGGLLSPLPAPVWLLTARKGNETAWALAALNERVRQLGPKLQDRHPESEAHETVLDLQAMGRISGAGLTQIARVLDQAGIAHDVRADGARKGHVALSLPTFAVNPFQLVRALTKQARGLGACICENASVASLEPQDGGVRVVLSDGSAINAKTVVVATNAYSHTVKMPGGARKAKAVRNFMLATGPLEPGLQERLGQGRRFVVELNRSYVFYRLHQGRLIYGGIESFGRSDGSDFDVPMKFRRGLEELVRRTIGGPCPEISRFWSGCYHATTTELPIIGRHPNAPAIVMNVGYGGTGVALTQIFSDLAASIALDRPQADTDARRLGDILQSTRLPVAQLLTFGGSIARQLLFGKSPA